MYTKSLLENITRLEDIPVVMITDSKSLKDNVESDNTTKDKRTAIAAGIIREAQNLVEIKVEWIEGKRQLVDVLTKDSVNPYPLRVVVQTGKFDVRPNESKK